MPATVTVYRGHRRTLLLPTRDYLPAHHVHRNYYEINLQWVDAPYCTEARIEPPNNWSHARHAVPHVASE